MANTLEITVPFAKRHLVTEIKMRGGRFDADKKNWSIEETADNCALKEMVERRVNTAPNSAERVKNVATLCADLLNGLKHRKYHIVEVGDRIVLESTPLLG